MYMIYIRLLKKLAESISESLTGIFEISYRVARKLEKSKQSHKSRKKEEMTG